MAWTDMADLIHGAVLPAFGDDFLYYAGGVGAGLAVSGVFNAASQMVAVFNGVEVSSVRPSLGVRLSDFSLPPVQGDAVRVGGILYEVVDSRPDGSGWSVLYLQKAQ